MTTQQPEQSTNTKIWVCQACNTEVWTDTCAVCGHKLSKQTTTTSQSTHSKEESTQSPALDEEFEQQCKDGIIVTACSKCDGGGADGQNKCSDCQGYGLVDWDVHILKRYVQTQINKAKEEGRAEALENAKEIYSALHDMWGQYCQPPYYHDFMSAGEHAEMVLRKYSEMADYELDLPKN